MLRRYRLCQGLGGADGVLGGVARVDPFQLHRRLNGKSLVLKLRQNHGVIFDGVRLLRPAVLIYDLSGKQLVPLRLLQTMLRLPPKQILRPRSKYRGRHFEWIRWLGVKLL